MAKRRHKKHHKPKNKKPTKRPFSYHVKGFFMWFIIYSILITILTILFEKTQIYQNKIGFYIIMGFILVLASRMIYSAIYSRTLRLKGFFIFGIIYTLVYGLVDYFLSQLNIQINPSFDKYIYILIFTVLFTIVLMFLRRMKIKKSSSRRNPILRAPSQILSGIALLIIGILFFRFSNVIFLQWFNWPEGIGWSWLIGIGFLIFGFLTLVAWWRNNVSMFTTKHNVKWHK